MFERRLKIFLGILCVMTLLLAVRAMQLQVFGRAEWRERAAEVLKRSLMIETTRGRILDHQGRAIAVDKPCIDACVDFRAIPPIPNEAWVRDVARKRLLSSPTGEYRRADAGGKRQMLAVEIQRVKLDIKLMWQHLADLSGKMPEEIDAIRQGITRKVQMRRRYVWFQRYEQARRGHEGRDPSPWYRRWLTDDNDAPELDEFSIEVAEQTDAHVILRAISTEVHNEIGKNLERYPGLELRASTHRAYPYGQAAAHVLGNLTRVNREDLLADPHIGNELRAYQPNDLIGRSGLEALCERLLRGQRGRIERAIGEDSRVLATRDPVPGMDVECTIDIELQHDIQELFNEVELHGPDNAWIDRIPMPGAAVVIDVPSGEVRAMVTSPSYDPTLFDDLYDKLSRDDLGRPLLNRATQFQLEPGSTVKPMVGLGAITQGIARVDETIECTGYLVLGGHTHKSMARCWVASTFFERLGGNVAHHPIPWEAPHPTGFLSLTDALERSCNIYFETVADRLKIEGLSMWFDRFGLGRLTGIGIAEVEGRLPNDMPLPAHRRRSAAWFSGIGQDQVLATPIQMANVAATIARDGVWFRPRLVPAGTEVATFGPERADLKLSKPALEAVRLGMVRAVNNRAGTGGSAKRDDLFVAGKTGSAQAQLLALPQRDEVGRVAKDEKGRPIWNRLEPIGTHASPNPLAPWYRATGAKETGRAHAWFIGFAPADHPQVAFAVMVEYGGSGGVAAGGIAKRMLDACIRHGYLSAAGNVARTQ